MRRRLPMLAAMLLALALSCAPEREQKPTKAAEAPVPKPPAPKKFEAAIGGWTFAEKTPMSSFSTEQKVTAEHSIKVVDASDTDGSNTVSAMVKIDPKHRYKLSWQTYPIVGEGLGVYAQFFNEKGEQIGDAHRGSPSTPQNQWLPAEMVVEPPANTTHLRVFIHSYQKAIVTAYVDDFKIEQMPPAPTRPPWEGTYKIKPQEKDKLTEADVVGPDGIVYPDWTWAGLPKGIPDAPVKAKAADFGARPDDDADDSAALQKALDALAEKGGGALLIEPGTFYLDRTLKVTADNIVIRGSGKDKTKLIFRYQDGPTEERPVCFFSPAPGGVVDRNTWIEIHCFYKNLMAMRIFVDDILVSEKLRSAHWGATFALGAGGHNIAKKVKDGKHILRGVAEYPNGKTYETKNEVTVDTKDDRPKTQPQSQAAILFVGQGCAGKKFLLAEDGRRGSRDVLLAEDHDLKAGDYIYLHAPATERWKTLTENKCLWGTYRAYFFAIEKMDGRRLRLNQPMRIEYPIIDGAYVQKWVPIRGCGVEDLYVEHTVPHWLSSVDFRNASECWARRMKVHRPGRHAVMFTGCKWCEIRDCEFDHSWHPLQGGGSAYVGWQHDCDCLMENCTVTHMRHGPCVQWAAVGNVIRNSTFTMSDGQWHAGWSTENLFENCVIDAAQGTGSYGHGFWGSPPHDEAHGPEGPRNVVYNCDSKSPKTAFWMGGMNENWIIVYNRFVAETGQAVFARHASFDHIIRGNVFILKDAKQPAVILNDRNCIGVEIIDNLVLGGSGVLVAGKAEPAAAKGNTFRPFGDAPRPTPAVPSIFEWQRRNKERKP
ncbi:MAG: right-handed parallel beta-helix repeat-containing protein [Planctomycetota bacterium]